MKTATFNISGMHCASCAARNERTLKKLEGVLDASVNFATHSARVVFDDAVVSVGALYDVVVNNGYQVLKPDGTPAPGFAEPRINLVFNRLPADSAAPKMTYAEQSGITVYGSATTRFLYEVSNTVRDGRAARGAWDANELTNGDYILRIIAADYSGNEAQEGRDLLITVR